MRLFREKRVLPKVKNITRCNNKFHVTKFYRLSDGKMLIWGSADDTQYMMVLDSSYELICQHQLPKFAKFCAANKDYIIYDEGKVYDSRKFKFDFKNITQEEIPELTGQKIFVTDEWLHLENTKYALPQVVENLDDTHDEKHLVIATHDLFKNTYNTISSTSLLSVPKHTKLATSCITRLQHNKFALEVLLSFGSESQLLLLILERHIGVELEFSCEYTLDVSNGRYQNHDLDLGAYVELPDGNILSYGTYSRGTQFELIHMPSCEVRQTFDFSDDCHLKHARIDNLIPLSDGVHVIAECSNKKLFVINLETKASFKVNFSGIKSQGFSIDYIWDIKAVSNNQIIISFADFAKNDKAQIFVMDFTGALNTQNKMRATAPFIKSM